MRQSIRARSIRAKRGRAVSLLAGVSALLLTTALIGTSPAGAVAQTRNFLLTGSSQLGVQAAQNFPAGSAISLQIDSVTGDITGGTSSIPTYDVVSNGVTIHVTISDGAPPSGNLDPTTGEMNLTVHSSVTLTIDIVPAQCVIGPFDIDLSSTNPGGADLTGDPLAGTITAQNFNVPAVVGTGGTGACPDAVAGAINSAVTGIGLPTDTSAEIMNLTETQQAVTTTVPVTLPPTTTTTTAPAAVAAEPAFTG
jgi:hypothetical protein